MRAFSFLGSLSVLFTATAVAQDAAAPPNFVLIMADDLGWGDVGFNGNDVVRTPHLDRLAAEGVRLDRFYAAAPVCSPTRVSFLTGRHPSRAGVEWAFEGALAPEHLTMAEALKDAGYATAHFGKWHVGHLSRTVKQSYAAGEVDPALYSPPWENGFDECFSVINALPSFNPYYLTCGPFGSDEYRMVMDRPVARGQREGGFVWRDRFWTGAGQFCDEWLEGPLPEILTDRTVDFMRRSVRAGRPFLALLWFSTPHTPVVAGPRHRAMYPDRPIREQHWYGSITAMDEQVGRLAAELEQLEVGENTLLLFCSDNGPTWVHELGSTGGLRGRKGSLLEGGIRVAAVASWPGRLPGERRVTAPISTSDLMPTLLAAAGARAPAGHRFDGADVLPLLEGRTAERPGPVGFHSPRLLSQARDTKAWTQRGGRQMAWMEGHYKLLSLDEGQTWELYDMSVDAGEERDLASEQPERVAAMRTRLLRWVEDTRSRDQ